MTTAGDLLQFILPVLAVSIAVVLLCFYHYSKKRRGSYDVTVSPLCTAQPGDGAQISPRHNSVDLPPPYSLFDPKFTSSWPGAALPPYEGPISLPMTPHL